MTDSTLIQELGQQLASKEAAVRMKARGELVCDGSPDVVRMLVSELYDSRQRVRWEAAKALTDIADPSASAALLHAIDDECADVRWAASEGLIKLQEVGLTAVLHGLLRRSSFTAYCHSAHHVLSELKRVNPDAVAPVLVALGGPQPAVSAPVAAFAALKLVKS